MTTFTPNFKWYHVQFILSHKRIGPCQFNVSTKLLKPLPSSPWQICRPILKETALHFELYELAVISHLGSTTSPNPASPLLRGYLCDITRRPFSHLSSINTEFVLCLWQNTLLIGSLLARGARPLWELHRFLYTQSEFRECLTTTQLPLTPCLPRTNSFKVT